MLVVGCSSKNESAAPTSSSSASAPVDEAKDTSSTEKSGFQKYDPPVELTAALVLRETDKLKNGDTVENNPMSRWARDKLGITIKYKWQMSDQNNALTQKIRLALASGEELPDVLRVDDAVLLNELIESGKIEPVGEAFEKYATDRTKEAFEKNSVVWQSVTKDGVKWSLPSISDGIIGDTIMWVRQDWLDAVGKSAPTNIQEFGDVLAAFKTKFPNKVPWTVAGKDNLVGYMGDAQFMFGATQITIWDKDGNGGLQYGGIQPSTKQALVQMHDYYEAGFLDPEFGTYDAAKAASLFTSGNAGIIFGPGWMGAMLNDTAKIDAAAVVKPYPIPSGVDGTIGRTGSPLSYQKYVFRKGFDHFDAIFQYWDAMLGPILEDPTSEFAAGFAEGYDYVMKDGEPSWEGADPGSLDAYVLLGPGNTPPGMVDGPSIFERVFNGKRDSIYEKKLSRSNMKGVEGKMVATQQTGVGHRNLFVGAPTKTMLERNDQLWQMTSEMLLKIIYGKDSPDAFDKYVEDWKAKGGEQITKEVNDWYKASQ